MRPWQAIAWTGGVVGAAVTGVAVGAVAHSTRLATRRKEPVADEHDGEELGRLKPDRQSTVAADDGVPLAVQEIKPADGGHADLTVVLVHGYALDSRCWHFQRRDLPKLTDPRVRVVLYDQRSHGRSGHSSRRRSTIEQLGRDLDAVVRATARRGPVVLVGHSMGGMSIMALAEQQPKLFRDRVRAVALVSTSAAQVGSSGMPKPWLSKRNPVTRGLGVLAGLQPELVERVRHVGGQVSRNIVRSLSFGGRNVSPALVDLMNDMINATTVEVVTDFLETLGAHDRRAALVGLKHCEVLVLSGDADRMTPFSHSEVIAGELPDAELVRVPEAGHMAMLERPELVTAQLTALVRRATVRSDAGDEEAIGKS